MSKKNVAAYLSGLAIGMPIAWFMGHYYGEPSVYPLMVVSLMLLGTSFALDKRGHDDD